MFTTVSRLSPRRAFSTTLNTNSALAKMQPQALQSRPCRGRVESKESAEATRSATRRAGRPGGVIEVNYQRLMARADLLTPAGAEAMALTHTHEGRHRRHDTRPSHETLELMQQLGRCIRPSNAVRGSSTQAVRSVRVATTHTDVYRPRRWSF